VDPIELEARMMAKIEAGETLESPDEMTPKYRRHLINLMIQHADSELAGGFGYLPWIQKAPTIDEKLIVANIVKDEIRHATVVYRLLRELGFDVDEHLRRQDLSLRVVEDEGAELMETPRRFSRDYRERIFYYPIETWADFISFNFMMDRAAGHQIQDLLVCSYGPWKRAAVGILKEEVMHIHHGEMWVERLAKDPATHDEIERTLGKWFLRVINIFGRPNTPKNALYRRWRLKARDNHDVRLAFLAEIQPKLDAWGLKLPPWTPPWEQEGADRAYVAARDEARFAAG
jgi:ring-1,2-phenylacetyl-CoA epoxidase subunit PaaA